MASEYDIVGAFQDIEMELIKSMRRNMKRHIGEEFQEGINWTQWQAEMLNGLAKYKEENADKLPKYFSTINQDIEEAIIEAYKTGESEQEIEILEAIRDGYKADKTGKGTNAIQGSFFKINEDKLNSLIQATTNDMQKAEHAILRMTDDVYRQTIFKAQMFYNTGAGTLWQAVDMATKDFLSAGINCVEYRNGARVNIASYSEMALRTANKRANLMGCADKRMEYGIHTVKISAHNSACPLCIKWQGKVYYDDVYGEVTQAERRGFGDYPLLSEAVKGGMFHPNCKNGLSTYYEGINQPPKEPTKEEKEEMVRRYNLQQEQRACERNIRKYKRLEAGSLDADNVAYYSKKKQEWIGAYNKLIADNSDVLRAEPARLKLYGIGAKDIKVVAQTKINTIEDINNSGSKMLAKAYEQHRIKNNLISTPYDELGDMSSVIINANYGKMSVETAKVFNDTFSELISEYDTPLQKIRTMTKDEFMGLSDSFACVSHNYSVDSAELVINTSKCKDMLKLKERINELSENGYCVKVSEELAEKYVATHEFAHTLLHFEDTLSNKKNWVNADYDKIKKARKEIKSVYNDYLKEVEELTEKRDSFIDGLFDLDNLERMEECTEQYDKFDSMLEAIKLGEYSLTNADEFMAEAFTNEKIGISSNKYGKMVIEVINKYFKR